MNPISSLGLNLVKCEVRALSSVDGTRRRGERREGDQTKLKVTKRVFGWVAAEASEAPREVIMMRKFGPVCDGIPVLSPHSALGLGVEGPCSTGHGQQRAPTEWPRSLGKRK